MKIYMALATSLLLAGMSVQAVETRTANNGNLVMEDVPQIPQQIVDDLTQYQNVRSAPFRAFNQAGDALYISTRFGDVAQIHKVTTPGGMRQQITFFDEPVGSLSRQPGSENLLFTMDAGGSEFAQIFLLDPSNGKSTMISDGESRNGAVLWSNKGDKIAYQSTRRNGRNNDVWMMDPTEPDKAKIALQSDDGSWWGPMAWDSKDSSLLVLQYVSVSDSRIYRVDLDSGEKQLLQGDGQSASSNYPQAFSANDKGYFFTTNQFSDIMQLAYHDFASGKNTIISKEIQWGVGGLVMDKARKRAVFDVNENGMSKVYLLNPDTFEYKQVASLPVGVIGGMAFSDDGRKLALTMNTPKSPSDSYVLTLGEGDLEYSELTRWTFSEVGGLNTDAFVEPQLVHFESFDQRQIPAFVYKPEKQGPHPVIISIHGGPESQYRPNFSSTVQLWINSLDAAVIAPNVRGSAGYGKEYVNLDNGFNREDSVKDIGALLDWIETQPDLDASRVAVIGGSYGGYMVLASAVHYSDRLKAAVDIVGISNFVTFLKNTQDYRRDLRRVEYGDERDPAMFEHLQKISPSNNVDKINVPMFVVQGENDPRVPVTEAEQIVKALREKGKPVWYMNALNEGHGYRKKENRDIYQQAVVLFFEQHL